MIIYLAGAETWFERFIEAGTPNILFSYFYMRTMRRPKFESMMFMLKGEQHRRERAGLPRMRLFLDSGAFTWLTHTGKKPDLKQYVRDFIEFVRTTSDLWDLVAELDIDDPAIGVASHEDVDGWREKLILAANGNDQVNGSCKVVQVWHLFLGRPKWTEMCADPRFPYLAMGSDITGQKGSLLAEAHRHGKQVHGFAETKLQTEAKFTKYDSVDSTTWLRPMKYGGFFVFQSNKLRVLDHNHKNDRRLFRSYFLKNGLDMDKIMREDQAELCKASLVAWKLMAERYEAQGAHARNHDEGVDDAVQEVDQREVTANPDRRGGHREDQSAHSGEREPVRPGSDHQRVVGSYTARADGGGDPLVHPSPERADAAARGAAGAQPGEESDRTVGPSGWRLPGAGGGDRNDGPNGCGPGVRAEDAIGRGGTISRDGVPPTRPEGRLMKPVLIIRNGVLVRPDKPAQVEPHGESEPLREVAQPVGKEPVRSRRSYEGVSPTDPATWSFQGKPRAIAARNTGHDFRTGEIASINEIGNRLGCAHCASAEPNDRRGVGTWIKDHLPPTDDLGPCTRGHDQEDGWRRCEDENCARHTTAQCLIPSCWDCSNEQGGGRNESVYTKPAREKVRTESTGAWRGELAPQCIHGMTPGTCGVESCASSSPEIVPRVSTLEAAWHAERGGTETKTCGHHSCLHPACIEITKLCGCDACKDRLYRKSAARIPENSAQGDRGENIEGEEREGRRGSRVGSMDTAIGDPRSFPGDSTPVQVPEGTSVVDQGSRSPDSVDPVQGGVSSPQNTVSVPKNTVSVVSETSIRNMETSIRGSETRLNTSDTPHGNQFGQVYSPGLKAVAGLRILNNLPSTVCSNCSIQGECPEFKEGAACAFTKAFGSLEVRSMDQLMALREFMLVKQRERTIRGMLAESLTAGGQIDPRVSQEMDRLGRMMNEWEATRDAPPPAGVSFAANIKTPEGEVSVQGSGRGGPGLLTRLFSAPAPELDNDPARPSETGAIDTTAVEKP